MFNRHMKQGSSSVGNGTINSQLGILGRQSNLDFLKVRLDSDIRGDNSGEA